MGQRKDDNHIIPLPTEPVRKVTFRTVLYVLLMGLGAAIDVGLLDGEIYKTIRDVIAAL